MVARLFKRHPAFHIPDKALLMEEVTSTPSVVMMAFAQLPPAHHSAQSGSGAAQQFHGGKETNEQFPAGGATGA
jgi:hypothetical protein